jgi:hypothetical protein
MTAIDFPDSPTLNQQFTVGSRTWKWTGVVWEFVGVSTITSVGVLDGGTPFTTEWPEGSIDAGMP